VPITCAITDAIFQSNLIVIFPSTVAHIDLVIEAVAHEQFASPELETGGIDWITVHNEQLVWEPQYYKDRKACEARFRHIVESYVNFDPFFDILHTLPDPPEGFGRVVRQLEQLSIAVKRLERSAPADARKIEHVVERTLGISPRVLHEIGRLPDVQRVEGLGEFDS
jgi:hypothetical protein